MNWRVVGRWLALVPASLGAAFLTGLVFDVFNPNRVAAVLSGMVYVAAALTVASAVAPSHRRIAIVVLGTFVLGDLVVAHLVLPDLTNGASPDGLAALRWVLRIDQYADVAGGGIARVVGAGFGGFAVGGLLLRSEQQPFRSTTTRSKNRRSA